MWKDEDHKGLEAFRRTLKQGDIFSSKDATVKLRVDHCDSISVSLHDLNRDVYVGSILTGQFYVFSQSLSKEKRVTP